MGCSNFNNKEPLLAHHIIAHLSLDPDIILEASKLKETMRKIINIK